MGKRFKQMTWMFNGLEYLIHDDKVKNVNNNDVLIYERNEQLANFMEQTRELKNELFELQCKLEDTKRELKRARKKISQVPRGRRMRRRRRSRRLLSTNK